MVLGKEEELKGEGRGGRERRRSYPKERCYFQDKEGGMLGSHSAQLLTHAPGFSLLGLLPLPSFADEVRDHSCHFT